MPRDNTIISSKRCALVIAGLMVFVISCATPTVPKEERAALYPPMTSQLRAALANAEPCDAPGIEASKKVGPDFKYGCFCGQSHPEFKHKSGVNYKELPLDDRLDLIARFYGQKPIDEIDSACRDHDVCWVYKGEEHGDCNTEFYHRLQTISKKMQSSPKHTGYDTKEARCAAFTESISQVFATHLIDSDYESTAQAIAANAKKLVLTPVALGEITVNYFRQAVLGREMFLREGERCHIGGDDDLMPPTDFSSPAHLNPLD